MKGGDSMTDNQNTSQNLTDDDRSKGGKASSSQQDMNKLGQMGGNTTQQHGDGHQLTRGEQSEGGSR
jgi:hypothetical protein